ncbi:MAG: class I SAM-dependent methyltransferase [Bacteroidales bacterium]|jgi:SAM-dependent methyltransferase|nr:class I SAM-dependent methyltransferase [Bacteroidales bacterium]
MENKQALDFFQKMANTTQEEKSVKLGANSNFTNFDAEFILKHVGEDATLLDLGSGTGLIINKIYNSLNHVVALEPFEGFTKFIVKNDNIEVVHNDILTYNPKKQFDLITLFGLMHYFNEAEAIKVYEKYHLFLSPKGKMIIKNQFGLYEDVCVEGYSEEQKCNYYAHYRYIENEKKILKGVGFGNIGVFDIYPPECNRWDNTHFYAIVAEK